MISFEYHPDILARYPNLVGGVILAQDMSNGPTPEEVKTAFIEEQRQVLQKIGSTPLSELETLSAWRSAFRAFDVNPTKYRSAPEALLRRLTKKGDIPFINTLVDLNNLISIRYALPVATFDVSALQGGVCVHFADSSERYTPLGETEIEHPESGEVVFSDSTKLVIARRWCWRQSNESAANPNTKQAIFTIEAMHPGGRTAVESALADLLPLLEKHVGGQFKSDVLYSENPKIAWE